MAKNIFCITNQKGGVGKTTTAHSLIAQLNYLEHRVLAIDLDSQCNLTSCLVPEEVEYEKSAYDLLVSKTNVLDCILPLDNGISIIPASHALAKADVMLVNECAREYKLRNALRPILSDYDYIVIDTPPTLGNITINAMTASKNLIIPCKADKFSKIGLNDLYATVEIVREACNPELKITGILLVCTEKRTVLYKKFKADLDELAKLYGTKVFKTYISECMSIKKAQVERKDIFEYRASCSAALDYQKFVDEVIEDDK